MAVFNPNPLPGAASPADTIELLGSNVARLYYDLELSLLRLLDEATAKGLATEALAERAAIAYEMQVRARQMVANVNGEGLANQAVAIAAAEGDAAALARLGLAPNLPIKYSGFSSTQAVGIASIAAQLNGGLSGMAAQILRSTADTYQRVTANVSAQVLGGTITRYQAGREATRQLLAEGLPYVEYANGARMPIGSYAEMATRTAANRAWQEGHIARLTAQDIHLVTIVVGIGACKACSRWAGKVLSTDGRTGTIEVGHAIEDGTVTVNIAGTLDQARADGWNHPNCRCSIAGYFPGLPAAGSRTTYSAEAEGNRTRLRELERGKRQALREQALAPDDLARAKATRKVRNANAQIGEHIERTGMVRQRYRESLKFTGTGPMPTPPRPRPITPPAPAAPAAARAPRPAAPPSQAPRVRTPEDVLGPKPPTTVPRGTSMADIQAARERLGAWEKAAIEIRRQNLMSTAATPLSGEARRAAFDAATDGAQIGKLLGRELQHRGITVKGFTRATDVVTAREYAETVAGLLEKYPQVIMHEVNIKSLSPTTYAQVRSGSGSGQVVMEMNSKWANNREGMLLALERDVAKGFHPDGFTDARGIIAHEFGHAIDAQDGHRAGKLAMRVLEQTGASLGYRSPSAEYSAWRRSQLPGYAYDRRGAYNGTESIAEAFADVELNGDRASIAHRALYAELLRSIGVTR